MAAVSEIRPSTADKFFGIGGEHVFGSEMERDAWGFMPIINRRRAGEVPLHGIRHTFS